MSLEGNDVIKRRQFNLNLCILQSKFPQVFDAGDHLISRFQETILSGGGGGGGYREGDGDIQNGCGCSNVVSYHWSQRK